MRKFFTIIYFATSFINADVSCAEVRSVNAEIRISQIENSIGELTAKIEELQFYSDSADKKTSKKLDDILLRLEKLEKVYVKESPKELYDSAIVLLKSKKYDKAAVELRKFIDKYSNNELTSNAYYWLGETFYAKRDFEQAAIYFLEGYTAFPKGNKAQGNLLKLAVSFSQINKIKESCATITKLFNEFPRMLSEIKERAKNERKRLKCL